MAGARHGMYELTAWHRMGTAGARHGHGMLCVNRPLVRSSEQKNDPYFKCKPISVKVNQLQRDRVATCVSDLIQSPSG